MLLMMPFAIYLRFRHYYCHITLSLIDTIFDAGFAMIFSLAFFLLIFSPLFSSFAFLIMLIISDFLRLLILVADAAEPLRLFCFRELLMFRRRYFHPEMLAPCELHRC